MPESAGRGVSLRFRIADVEGRRSGRAGRRLVGFVMAIVVLTVVIGCGSSNRASAPTTTAATATTTMNMPMDHQQSQATGENACPVEGCSVKILKVVRHGRELQITWHANYAPDESRNHIHVYWDIYTADQVSNDAASRGVKQGEWVPTDAYPAFVTEGAVSVAKRGKSTTLCVTAGDGNHDVIDSSIVNCHKVTNLLNG